MASFLLGGMWNRCRCNHRYHLTSSLLSFTVIKLCRTPSSSPPSSIASSSSLLFVVFLHHLLFFLPPFSFSFTMPSFSPSSSSKHWYVTVYHVLIYWYWLVCVGLTSNCMGLVHGKAVLVKTNQNLVVLCLGTKTDFNSIKQECILNTGPIWVHGQISVGMVGGNWGTGLQCGCQLPSHTSATHQKTLGTGSFF